MRALLLPAMVLVMVGCQQKPPDPHEAPGLTRCAGDPIAVELDRTGTTLRLAEKNICIAPRVHDALDGTWLKQQLTHIKRPSGCIASIVIDGEPGVRYQEAVWTIGAIGTTDFDPELGTLPSELSRIQNPPGRDCDDVTLAAGTLITSPPARGSDALRKAPVISLSRTELLVGDKHVATIEEDWGHTDRREIDALLLALPQPGPDPFTILQADKDSSLQVINRVIRTAKSAGYTDVVFAVRN